MAHSIVEEELELLESVLRALDQVPEARPPAEAELARELESIRRVLVSGEEQKDRVALLQQWDRGTALLRQLQSSAKAPVVDRTSPYFAHMRLREGARERDVCLGKATCIRAGVRVVDWRNAPVSRLFYRYRQGEPYEEEMGGRTLEGELLVRRTLSIRGSRLDRIDAPEGSFRLDPRTGWERTRAEAPQLSGGEGAAVRAHGLRPPARRLGTDPGGAEQRADKHLPDVAGLLDVDQFELISRAAPGTLVVRGSAGSGKTTVALHRIAYLAFEDAGVDSARTLFVTLSPGLRDYVSHVLPGLGVHHVRVTTFQEWAAQQRRRLFPRLPTETRFDAPDFVRRVKLHPALGAALEAHVRSVAGPRDAAQVIDDWSSLLVRRELLEEVFERVAPGRLGSADVHNATEWCRVRNEELQARLDGDPDAQAELDPEDDAILLRAWQLRSGPLPFRGRRPLRYRHVAVDEVQDFSPLELRVLIDCLGHPPSLTLAGDTQQHISQHGGFSSWDELFDRLGLPDPEVRTLQVSYRSTREIMEFAHGLLGSLGEEEAPPPSVRTGPPVEIFRFTDAGACVAFLADALRALSLAEPLASIAVLTPSRAASGLYHEGLERSEVPRLRRVLSQDFSFAPGVEVTEIEQAKGLEFDYVVLADTSAGSFPDTPSARRLLHVGATRAIHQLWITHVGTPSPILEKVGTP
ncbi:MAG: 3'-5' exonuclease [Myxococcota bacterium]|nr:3'-5' exonuclease [Myxococcota bacterium]